MTEQSKKVLFSLKQILDYYDIGRKFFRELVEAGAPAKKIGDRWVLHTEEFEEFMRDYCSNPASK